MTALLQRRKPEHGRLNTHPTSQQPMVLQQRSLPAPQRSSNLLPLLLTKHHALERVVQRVVLVERACVLGDDVELAAERTERAPVDGVRVCNAVYFWARGVDRVVDHVGCLVEEAHGAALDDVAGGVDEDEIRGLQERPGDAEGVDPEGGRLYGVLGRLVSA